MTLNVQRGYPLGSDISTSEVQDNAVTLAKVAHHTGEGVLVYDAAGVPVVLDGGSAGDAVKMNAGGTALELATAGGQLELIENATLSGNNISFDSISGYKYLFLVGNIGSDSGTTSEVLMTFNTDTGANYKMNSLNGTTITNITGANNFLLTHLNSSDTTGLSIVIGVEDLGAAGRHVIHGNVGGVTTEIKMLASGHWDSTGSVSVTAIDLDLGTGNFIGNCTLYGIKEV